MKKQLGVKKGGIKAWCIIAKSVEVNGLLGIKENQKHVQCANRIHGIRKNEKYNFYNLNSLCN